MNFIIQFENNNYPFDFCYQVYTTIEHINWFRGKKIHTIEHLSLQEINSHIADKNNIYVGSIEFIQRILKKLTINIPDPLNIPIELIPFAGRNIKSGFLKDLTYPTFIKPLKQTKLFTGCLLDKPIDFKLFIPEIDENTPLFISEPINIESEWRGFVLDKKLIDCKHYSGDFKITPDYDIVEACIKSYHSAPAAYTIDFAVTQTGETLLIEVNDFYGCGTYGFGGEKHLDMIVKRFRELIK